MFKARNFKSHGLPPFRSLKSLGQPLPLRSHAPQPRDSATLRSSLVTPTLPSTTMTSATGRPVIRSHTEPHGAIGTAIKPS